ncbi:MAG: cytochrome P450 [Acidobacteriota bacterium]|nr:cytochrome P450 [Acidobacteriota bacterium]
MPELPPGPRAPRFFQMFRWIFRPVPLLRACAETYGDAFTLRLVGTPPVVFFSDPAAIRQIFSGDPEHLRAGQANRVSLEHILGPNSILLLDGARHKRERKLLMPPFHGERMRLYGELMTGITDQSIESWPLERSFPVHSRMQQITLEIILRAVFGVDEGPLLSDLRTRLIRWLNFIAGPLETWIGLTQHRYIRRRDPLLRRIDRLLYDQIARCKKSQRKKRADILAMLVAARDEHGRPMSDEEIRDEIITMLVAGHETTATSLAWVIYRLLQNPQVLAKARAEVDSVTGEGRQASRPIGEQVAGLGYLDSVIKETARLNPVLPIAARYLGMDMRIGNHELPAGSIVLPCIYLTHRQPELWPEPEAFNPDRFLGRRVDPYTFFPFGGGVRHCLGAAFASYEMKIVLARVLSRVTLRLDPRHTVRVVRRGITFAPSGGVRVIRAAD